MSKKFSTTTPLALPVKKSRHQILWGAFLCAALVLSLLLIAHSTQPGWLYLLLPLHLWAACTLFRQPMAGACLGWRSGQWFVVRGSVKEEVELESGWACVGPVFRLGLRRRGGQSVRFFLFGDALAPQARRALRRRLALER